MYYILLMGNYKIEWLLLDGVIEESYLKFNTLNRCKNSSQTMNSVAQRALME